MYHRESYGTYPSPSSSEIEPESHANNRIINPNQNVLSRFRSNFETLSPVGDLIHEKLIDLFHLYLIVGGMPSAVKKYLETNNLKDVVQEQENICSLYREDISKYDIQNKLYIKEIFDLIPSELNNQNKRFIMKNLNESIKFSRYENSFI